MILLFFRIYFVFVTDRSSGRKEDVPPPQGRGPPDPVPPWVESTCRLEDSGTGGRLGRGRPGRSRVRGPSATPPSQVGGWTTRGDGRPGTPASPSRGPRVCLRRASPRRRRSTRERPATPPQNSCSPPSETGRGAGPGNTGTTTVPVTYSPRRKRKIFGPHGSAWSPS